MTAAQQVKGSVKKAIGNLTGDAATEAQGGADKAAAEAENAERTPVPNSSQPSKP